MTMRSLSAATDDPYRPPLNACYVYLIRHAVCRARPRHDGVGDAAEAI